MATPDLLERSPSATSSVLSTIHVGARSSRDVDSTSNGSRQSTPLSMISSRDITPVNPSMTSIDLKKETIGARQPRKRKSASSQKESAQSSRNVSGLTGATLIDEEDATHASKKRKVHEEQGSSFPQELPPRVVRRSSVKKAVQHATNKVRSVLGKRTRQQAPAGKMLKELDTGSGGLLQEIDLDAVDEEIPAKRTKRLSKVSVPTKTEAQGNKAITKPVRGRIGTRKGKLWLSNGLYAGQTSSTAASKNERKKLQKNKLDPMVSSEKVPDERKHTFISMPMFGFLDHQRDFIIPFDVFAPSFKKGDEKPKDWHQLNRNRLVGEAKELWEKDAPLARSLCICARPEEGSLGCGDDCLNRAMHYECDENNCGLSPSECSNRAFTTLAARVKKGGAFDVGVEVLKTDSRGFGVRACREFAPGEIIMEYTGEIISEGECQRRMRELYAAKHCYYIMEFDQGLHIDGTKGSMARFVNHSCEPNCEVRMVKVNGTPRMAIFAAEQGVFTGEELTYDYNFDNFSENKQACYCGAPTCRGHLARRLNAAEQKIRDREDRERREQAEQEAKRIAAEKEREKEVKSKRGSGWRGWVTLGEIKEDLKLQKAAQAEAEKNSTRAQRLAARQSGVAVTVKVEPKRRVSSTRKSPEESASTQNANKEPQSRPESKRSISIISKTGQSKFAEHLAEDDIGAFVSDSMARFEELEKSLEQEPEVDVATEEDSSDAQKKKSGKRNMIKSSTVKASSMGKAVLHTVERAVVDGFRQGKVKVMRQSTLSFTKMV